MNEDAAMICTPDGTLTCIDLQLILSYARIFQNVQVLFLLEHLSPTHLLFLTGVNSLPVVLFKWSITCFAFFFCILHFIWRCELAGMLSFQLSCRPGLQSSAHALPMLSAAVHK